MELSTAELLSLFVDQEILVVGNGVSARRLFDHAAWCDASTTLVVFNHGPAGLPAPSLIRDKAWRHALYVCAAEPDEDYQQSVEAFFALDARNHHVFFNEPYCRDTSVYRDVVAHGKTSSYALIEEDVERRYSIKDPATNTILSSGALICRLLTNVGAYRTLRVGGVDCFSNDGSLHFFEHMDSHGHDSNVEIMEWSLIGGRRDVILDTGLLDVLADHA